MKIFLYGLLGLVCVLFAAGSFIYFAAPTGVIRNQMIAAVKSATGRDLVVAGSTSFTVYPSVGVRLENVTLSGPPGMDGPDFVSMKAMDVSIPLLPLLSRKIAIEKFVLVKPVFELHVDAQGRQSWSFARRDDSAAPALRGSTTGTDGADGSMAGAAGAQQTAAGSGETGTSAAGGASAQDGAPTGTSRGLAAEALDTLSLGDVRIENGIIRYSDDRTRSRSEVTGINVAFKLANLAKPLNGSGSAVWNGVTLPFSLILGSPKNVLEGQPSDLSLKLDGEELSASFEGRMAAAGGLELAGQLKAGAKSARALAGWLGIALPASPGFGPFKIDSELQVKPKVITLSDTKVSLDGATATGTVTVSTSQGTPSIEANLEFSRLDLNLYLPGADGATALAKPAKSAKNQAKAAGSESAAADASGSDEAIAADGGETGEASAAAAPVKTATGKPAPVGWSAAPIDLAGLKAVDAEAKLTSGGLIYRQVKVGKSSLVVSLRGGFLKIRLPEMELYDGTGVGTVALDGRAPTPRIDANFTVKGVSALPLLKDAAGFDWVAGKGDLSFGFTGTGASQKAIVAGLQGQGRFDLTDGAIVGLDVPQMARTLLSLKIPSLQRQQGQKTEFAQLSGTTSIQNGILTNKDLLLTGPQVRMTGAGTVDLPQQTIDYLAQPKVLATQDGQGDVEKDGIGVPVKIVGPWSKPKAVPDLNGVVKNPQSAVDAAKKLLDKVKGGDKLKSALDGLLGNKKSQGEVQPAQ